MKNINNGAMPPMKIEYAQVEENIWLCYYRADGFKLVKPIDTLHPSMPALGEVDVLGAVGSGNTKRKSLDAAKRRFKEVYHMGCFYRRKGDLTEVFPMYPLWDWSEIKTKRTRFHFTHCTNGTVIAAIRKFSCHPSVGDWVEVQDQFLDKSPREIKRALCSAMKERIAQLKDGWVPLVTPVSFGSRKLKTLTPP